MNEKINLEIDYKNIIIKEGKLFGKSHCHILLPRRFLNKKVIVIESD